MATQDAFDRTIPNTPNNRAVHRISDEVLEDGIIYSVHRFTWEGSYADCKAMRNAYYVGQEVTNDDTFLSKPTGVSYGLMSVISNIQLAENKGGRGRVSFTVKAYRKGHEGNIDFERIDKDILTWRSQVSQNKPDLNIIRLWQKMHEVGRDDLYGHFKYINDSGAEVDIPDSTATKVLAEMIAKGIESFPDYVPVLNVTTHFPFSPYSHDSIMTGLDVGMRVGRVVGSEGSEYVLEGFEVPYGDSATGSDAILAFQTLAAQGGKVLITADKMQMNGDGTYTLNTSFALYRGGIEKELYVNGGGQFGPYDSGSGS